jgi:peptidyl-prolyl cis-trans isomerase SurA
MSAAIALGMLVVSSAAREKLDGIVAVVGDSVILESEVRAYAYMKARAESDTLDSASVARSAPRLVDELIDGKVLLVHAEKDTNIAISPLEVDRQLDARIQFILQQNRIDMDQFATLLEQEQGISLNKFRQELRGQIRQELIKQRVQQMYVSNVGLTRSEVTEFYEQYKDSIPPAGESVLLSVLRVRVKPSAEVRQKAFEKISTIKQRLDNGEDFAKLAEKFSDGPNAAAGGDLGIVEKGTLSELAFEQRLFQLEPGEISEPFETRLGFHVVHVTSRKGQTVEARQIMVRVAPPEEEKERVALLLDSLAKSVESSDQFAAAVRKHSTDQLTRSRGGQLRWKETSQLSQGVRQAIQGLPEGEISSVVRNGNELSIYRVDDRTETRRLTLEDDYSELEALARRISSQQKLIELVKKWRKETYVDIRL